jgi:uncharacterized membrane protein (DUF106 family)
MDSSSLWFIYMLDNIHVINTVVFWCVTIWFAANVINYWMSTSDETKKELQKEYRKSETNQQEKETEENFVTRKLKEEEAQAESNLKTTFNKIRYVWAITIIVFILVPKTNNALVIYTAPIIASEQNIGLAQKYILSKIITSQSPDTIKLMEEMLKQPIKK